MSNILFQQVFASRLAGSRRANLVALAVMLLLFTLPYWQYGIVRDTIAREYGYQV